MAVLSATRVFPFRLMFGRHQSVAYDSSSYSAHFQAKLAELQDFVETNLTAAASNQKLAYENHTASCRFSIGCLVWHTVPTAGKLDPR